jgi:hypothetical protein
MVKALSEIIFSDPLVTGLEDRARREGALSEHDYKLSQFIKPALPTPSVSEATALDLICLYGQVVVESKRFDLQPIRKRLGEGIIVDRGDNIRKFTLALDTFNDGEFCGIQKNEFHQLKFAAAYEAQFIVRRDIDFYLNDARRKYEAEVPKQGWSDQLGFDNELSHNAVTNFLKYNMFWLVDVFDFAYDEGCYNRLIEVDDLINMGVRAKNIRQFRFFAKSARFDAYFSYLQEAYISLYENSFLGRLTSMEVAYERAPDRGLMLPSRLDVGKLSRIIRVNLADVVDYFPLPRTLEEAVEFRSHPRVKPFKLALNKWLKSFSTEPELESKIRRDLQLANRDLRLLKSWRSIKSRPLFFGVKTTVQAVPVLGTILTAFDVVDYFIERHVSRRWAWVVMPGGRLDSGPVDN